jgi:hypothetical protein
MKAIAASWTPGPSAAAASHRPGRREFSPRSLGVHQHNDLAAVADDLDGVSVLGERRDALASAIHTHRSPGARLSPRTIDSMANAPRWALIGLRAFYAPANGSSRGRTSSAMNVTRFSMNSSKPHALDLPAARLRIPTTAFPSIRTSVLRESRNVAPSSRQSGCFQARRRRSHARWPTR